MVNYSWEFIKFSYFILWYLSSCVDPYILVRILPSNCNTFSLFCHNSCHSSTNGYYFTMVLYTFRSVSLSCNFNLNISCRHVVWGFLLLLSATLPVAYYYFPSIAFQIINILYHLTLYSYLWWLDFAYPFYYHHHQKIRFIVLSAL